MLFHLDRMVVPPQLRASTMIRLHKRHSVVLDDRRGKQLFLVAAHEPTDTVNGSQQHCAEFIKSQDTSQNIAIKRGKSCQW